MFFRWSPRGICLVAALIGLLSFVEGFNRSRDDRAFDLYGKHAFAHATDGIEQVTSKRGTQVTGVSYNVDLAFTTEDGQDVTVRHMNLDRDHLDTATGGHKLELVYLPRNPSKVRWPGWEPQSSQTTWGSLLLFLAAGAGFWFLRRPAR